MIPDEIVERVREEADAVSVIGEYVKLKRVGNSFRGPCPFHHGKNANFSVSHKGGYKCFVCGESGDVFTFMQKHLGLTFVEAVKAVGDKVGVEVQEVARTHDDQDAREPLWEVNATAADFFRWQLWDEPAGQVARDYLASRGLGRAEADRFGIGYAPRDLSLLSKALDTLGFGQDRQLAAGLLVMKEDRPEARPRFRDRLMFPIYDPSDHVVGFGGRLLGPGEPKYLNTGESEIYSKRKVLYGLNWAKQSVRKADRLVIVEGYFDVVRMMAAGITETVATSGTALTEQQAALIRKYTKNVFLLYDSDKAGLKATFRAGDALLANGAAVRVISLPNGEDPDTYVAKYGSDGFERAAAESVDILDRKIQILERGGWFSDLWRKREAIDKLLPTIRVTADQLTRDLYITRASEVAGVTRDMLLRELASAAREAGFRERSGVDRRAAHGDDGPPFLDDSESADQPARAPLQRPSDRTRGVRSERELVRALVHHRRFVDPAAERVGPAMFLDPVYAAIFAELSAGDSNIGVDILAAALDEQSTEVLQDLLNEPGGLDQPEEVINGAINALLARVLADRLSDIDRLMPLAASDEKDRLMQEKQRLSAEITALGRPRWKHFG